MANWTTVNAIWYGALGTGGVVTPTVTGEVLANMAQSAANAADLEGFVAIVVNGSGAAGTINWIDGTQKLLHPPKGIWFFRHDPPAYENSVYYPTNSVVLGSGHVQQATTGGLSAASGTPAFSTSGGTVADGKIVWTDLGAIDATPVLPNAVSAITSTSCTLTNSANGTNTQVAVMAFRLVF